MAISASLRSMRGDVRTVWIANAWPELDAGRFPVKRVVGETLEVSADILREGHEALAAVLKYRTVKDTSWREVPMEHVDNDRWAGRFVLEENTRYVYAMGRLQVHELTTDQRQPWRGPAPAIRLDPVQDPAAIFRVAAFPQTAFDDLGY